MNLCRVVSDEFISGLLEMYEKIKKVASVLQKPPKKIILNFIQRLCLFLKSSQPLPIQLFRIFRYHLF